MRPTTSMMVGIVHISTASIIHNNLGQGTGMTLLPTCHPVARNPKIMLPGFMKGRYCQDNLDISLEGCIQMSRNAKNCKRKPMQHALTYRGLQVQFESVSRPYDYDPRTDNNYMNNTPYPI